MIWCTVSLLLPMCETLGSPAHAIRPLAVISSAFFTAARKSLRSFDISLLSTRCEQINIDSARYNMTKQRSEKNVQNVIHESKLNILYKQIGSPLTLRIMFFDLFRSFRDRLRLDLDWPILSVGGRSLLLLSDETEDDWSLASTRHFDELNFWVLRRCLTVGEAASRWCVGTNLSEWTYTYTDRIMLLDI